MKIIITMAGEGSRFKEKGIMIPKHEICVKNKSLFEWSMLSLNDFFDQEFIFITRKGKYEKSFIYEKCIDLGIKKYYIIDIDFLTEGQAETVMFADKWLNENDEIIIYNIDTYVKENSILKKDILEEYTGFIPVFYALGNKWSFVKLDENNNVIDVSEKNRISDLGSIGLYYFKSWKLYKDLFYSTKDIIKSQFKEIYIAPMYKKLIEDGNKVGIKIINSIDVHVLGTPEDIDTFLKLN